jgi:PAS domain S-box-containing protein
VFAMGVYNATSVAAASLWQRGEVIAFMLWGAAFIWFIADYTSQKPKKILYIFTAYFLLAAAVQIVDRSELTWLSTDYPSIKEILLPNGFEITYYEMTPGLFTNIQSLLSIPVFIFMAWMVARYYRSGNRKNALPLIVSLLFLWAGVFNDTLVSSGVYAFVYLTEYAFIAIILLMAVSLAQQVATVSDALQASEERYRSLIESSPDAIAVYCQGEIIYINPRGLSLIGAESPEQVLGKPVFDFIHHDYRANVEEQVQGSVTRNGPAPVYEEKLIDLHGVEIDVEVVSEKIIYQDKPAVLLFIRNVTERKQAEQEIARRAEVFEVLYETTQSLTILGDIQSLLGTIVSQAQTLLNTSAGGIYLYDPKKEVLEVIVATDSTIPVGTRLKLGEGVAGRVAQSREPMIVGDYYLWEGRSSSYEGIPVRAVLEVPMIFSGELIGVLVVHEVGESTRKFTEEESRLLWMFATQAASAVHETRQLEKIRRYLEELEMVNRLSTALRAARSIEEMLPILIDETLSILHTEAGCIWLYSPESEALNEIISRGWFTGISEEPMILGEGIAGSVYISGESYQSPEFAKDPLSRASTRSQIPAGWGGVCLPIKNTDEVIGVFFVATRLPRQMSDQEVRLFSTLAEIGGITINRMRLYEGTVQQAAELEAAYEATLQGWAKALEFRDQETEGHSRRIMEMTISLARAMGLGQEELTHIRRGVLLHDIGKMTVPDSILQKPGPLDENEWEIMRQHPVHAFELLRPITYLRPTLVIPFCHHEKWDGSGYPRGLKGEEIPLAARIFAVIDVWDALRSDRPYRRALPNEVALQYIKDQSGKHFDPQVVEAFLRVFHLG